MPGGQGVAAGTKRNGFPGDFRDIIQENTAGKEFLAVPLPHPAATSRAQNASDVVMEKNCKGGVFYV